MDDTLSEISSSSSFKYVKTIKIACGCYHSVLLSDRNEVFTFGRGNHGQLGHGNIFECRVPRQVAALRHKRAVKVSAGFYHTVVLVDNSAPRSAGSLSLSLEKLLNSQTRADVRFCVEGKELYAHRCIIYSRCRRLDDLITREACKGEELIVLLVPDDPLEPREEGKAKPGSPPPKSRRVALKVPEMSYDSFYKFIAFLYTDKLDLQSLPKMGHTRTLAELMTLGERFGTEKLRTMAEYLLKKSLSIDTVATTLKLSYDMHDECLKAHCMEFIMKHFGEVIGTPAFAELPSPILKEVLGAASKMGATVQDNQKT